MGTNVRDTSLLALQQIQAEGILGAVQWRVYALLYVKGPLTAREVTRHFEVKEQSTAITTYQPRLRELEGLGVVRRVGERPCQITGRLAYQWDVTSYVPKHRPFKGPRKTRLFLDDRVRLERLRAECVSLFNHNRLSDDFYQLILFLEERIHEAPGAA